MLLNGKLLVISFKSTFEGYTVINCTTISAEEKLVALTLLELLLTNL